MSCHQLFPFEWKNPCNFVIRPSVPGRNWLETQKKAEEESPRLPRRRTECTYCPFPVRLITVFSATQVQATMLPPA